MSGLKWSDTIDENEAVCRICFRHCRLREGQEGFCRARKNRKGLIEDENYGRITSLALDPIEKKPLAMFHPGSMILSAGSYGCNLRCPFCQNASISMADREGTASRYFAPQELVDLAASLKKRGNIGVAYTYNEPLVGLEFVLDTARQVRLAGMKNVLVSNGCVSEEAAEEVLKVIDGANIDLKCFSEQGYEKLGGNLEQVCRFIQMAAGRIHLELTTLIVPGLNDSSEMMEAEAAWIAGIDADIPLHVTRYFPCYQMNNGRPTDAEVVCCLAKRARKYLKHVFVGNC